MKCSSTKNLTRALRLVALTALVTGCATGGGGGGAPVDRVADAGDRFPRVDFNDEGGALGPVVRRLGEATGGSVVLMHGLEERAVRPMTFQRAKFGYTVQALAAEAEAAATAAPYYQFIHGAGYEALNQLDLAPALSAHFAEVEAEVVFGAHTRLYNVFAALSRTLGITVLGDNAVADARCGEVRVAQAPLHVALEAVLKSARIPPGAVVVETGPGHIFLRSAANPNTGSVQLGADGTAAALLEKRITAVVPDVPDEGGMVAFVNDPVPLGKALSMLTEQTGIAMRTIPSMAQVPVNYSVFEDLPLGTVLDLLIRQWPVAEFGYRIENGEVHITPRPRVVPPEAETP